MIRADFLAGANLENEDPTVLLQSISRFFKFLPGAIVARNALVNLADTADGQGTARNRGYSQAFYSSFPNAVAAGLNADGSLTAKSPNRRAGTDGKDVGVDFAELERSMAPQTLPR